MVVPSLVIFIPPIISLVLVISASVLVAGGSSLTDPVLASLLKVPPSRLSRGLATPPIFK